MQQTMEDNSMKPYALLTLLFYAGLSLVIVCRQSPASTCKLMLLLLLVCISSTSSLEEDQKDSPNSFILQHLAKQHTNKMILRVVDLILVVGFFGTVSFFVSLQSQFNLYWDVVSSWVSEDESRLLYDFIVGETFKSASYTIENSV